jgi:hypothetical protein
MAEKRTKADKQERQTEQLEKRADRHPNEIENDRDNRDDVNAAPAQIARAPKSAESTALIPIEQQIQRRANELYERRGRTVGYDLDDWLKAEYEIRGREAKTAKA